MRSPSARCYTNICNIFISSSGRDTDGGVQFIYPTTPTYSNVPCSIQPETQELIDGQMRITQETTYRVYVAPTYQVSPRDKIVYVDILGVTRTIFVEGPWDPAGRGSLIAMRATERQ